MKCHIGTNYEKSFVICFVAFIFMQNSRFLILWGNKLRDLYAINDNSIFIDGRRENHMLRDIPAIFEGAIAHNEI